LLSRQGRWMAAVLASGPDALLSHHAGALGTAWLLGRRDPRHRSAQELLHEADPQALLLGA
jgi:hypothetical protein